MAEVLHEPHLIHDLEDVTRLLDQAINDELDHYDLKIVDLEKFSMHLKGDKFHQTITPSLMKGFIDLQTAIYRSYAQIKYDNSSALRLSKSEKDALELEVRVIKGSSGFEPNIQEILENLLKLLANKMTSRHVFILALSTILLFGGYEAYNLYLDNQKDIRLAEIALEKDAHEKQERLATIALVSNKPVNETEAILNRAAMVTPEVNNIREEAKTASHSLIKSAQAANSIDFNNGKIKLSGEAAKELSRTSPTKWTDVRIDGVYHIINVDSSHSAKRKIRIRNVETQQETLAILENDTTDEKYLNIIQEAEWGYTPVKLKVYAKELNGIYKEAQIKEAIALSK